MRSLNRKHVADVSGCISTLIGNGVKSKHRSLFVISGDNIKEKIVKLHTIVGDTSTVLWCSKDKLSLQGKKRKSSKRKSSFNKFLKSIVLTECLYKDSQRVLGNTFGMCILQDFEALTPVLLQRTIDTVVGGGLIILLLPSSPPLEDLEAMAMDVHKRFCTESRTHTTGLFNLRFRSSIACSKACVAMDDKWSISTISSYIKSIAPVAVPDKEGCEGLLDDINSLMDEHHENVFVAPLVKNCCTLDQGKAVVTFLDAICDKTFRDNIALLAARGFGKSAALGLAVAGAVAAGYSNIFVTAPSPENLKSLFEFVLGGFDSLEYKEYIDYRVFRSTDHKFQKEIVQIDIHKQHRQTIQYIQPHEQERLFRVELLVVDEVAAIPTAVVKSLLGPYLVFISSITCNGYEGTDRSLTLLRQLTEQNQMSKDLNVTLSGRIFKKIELNEPIRYASGDPIVSWLNGLLCLDAANDIVDSTRGSLNNLEKSELYYVNRGTLFRYQGQSELFLQRMMALFAASQFENSPIDLQLMADAPEHHFFVLLGPVDESKKHQPDILCVIQVSLEGKISQESAERSLKAFHFPHGDEISWKFCELFQNTYFPSLSGARILRIATHPNIMQSAHYSVAHHAVELLTRYFEGQWDSTSDMDDTDCINKPPVSIVPAAEKLLSPKEPRTDLPPPLEHLCSEHLEKVHYICVSFGLTLGLLEFWRRQNFEPFYVGQIPNDVTGEHTCMVLKHIQAVNIQWGCVYQDFKQRFSRLLSSSFCSMDYNLAMSVLDPTINFAKSEAAKSNIDKVLEEHISFLDLKRLQFYVNNSADFPRIEDLVHVFSHLYFQGRIPVTLSLNQASVLLCAGLQRRDISHIEILSFNFAANIYNLYIYMCLPLKRDTSPLSNNCSQFERQDQNVYITAMMLYRKRLS